jgi:hypothetical protein
MSAKETTFRDSLLAHMKQSGIGATELSKKSSVSKQKIDKLFQKNTYSVQAEDAVRLARVFGKTVEEMCPESRSVLVEKISQLLPNLSHDRLLEVLALLTRED